MKIHTGDTVIVRTGKDRGKTGKVLRAYPKDDSVVVAGVNIVKKHTRARKTNQKGQIVDKAMPVHVSNVSLVDPKTSKPTRVRIVKEGGKRTRVSMSGATI
jgi:large subunit ribosomal protein L24